MKTFFRLFFAGMLLMVSLPGCAKLFGKKEKAETAPSAEGEAKSWVVEEKPDVQAAHRTIEIVWQVPPEMVEKYHIYYGPVESKLDQHREVRVSELQKFEDPQYGPVFRFMLEVDGAPRIVYFTVQAENKSGLSPRSPTQRVEIK